MKRIELVKVEHNIKIGQECPSLEPNITEDCFLMEEGKVIGFFIKDISTQSEKLSKFIAIAE